MWDRAIARSLSAVQLHRLNQTINDHVDGDAFSFGAVIWQDAVPHHRSRQVVDIVNGNV